MTSPLRRRIRHTRRWLGYGLMVLLIFVALLVAVANQMLPMVERHPDRIAAWLGDRVGQRVQFSRARGEWTRRGPRFILDELRVGEGDSTLHIGRAELLVAIYSGLLPGWSRVLRQPARSRLRPAGCSGRCEQIRVAGRLQVVGVIIDRLCIGQSARTGQFQHGAQVEKSVVYTAKIQGNRNDCIQHQSRCCQRQRP